MEGLIGVLSGALGFDARPVVWPSSEEKGSDAVLEGMLPIEGTALEPSCVVKATEDSSGLEGYAIAELALGGGVVDGRGEVGEIGDTSIDEGTRVMVDMTTVSPEVVVLVSVVPTPSGSDVERTGSTMLGDGCVLDANAGGVEVADVGRGVRVIKRPVRVGGAMLFNHSVEPLITE